MVSSKSLWIGLALGVVITLFCVRTGERNAKSLEQAARTKNEARIVELEHENERLRQKMAESNTYICTQFRKSLTKNLPVLRFKNGRSYSGNIVIQPAVDIEPGETIKAEWLDREGTLVISIDHTLCPRS